MLFIEKQSVRRILETYAENEILSLLDDFDDGFVRIEVRFCHEIISINCYSHEKN